MANKGRKVAIPQSITLTGIFFGLLSILWAEAQPYWACVAIVGAAFCDLVDGRVARFTGTSSEFGAELDSLADVVSFGMAPAIVVYHFGISGKGVAQGFDPWVLVPFLYVACGAIRLARFNVATGDVGEMKDFQGIPIPVAALLLTTLVMASVEVGWKMAEEKIFMAPFVVIVALLMVSSIPLPSFKHFSRRRGKYLFFGSIAVGFLILGLGGAAGALLFGILLCYVLLGVFRGLVGRSSDASVSE